MPDEPYFERETRCPLQTHILTSPCQAKLENDQSSHNMSMLRLGTTNQDGPVFALASYASAGDSDLKTTREISASKRDKNGRPFYMYSILKRIIFLSDKIGGGEVPKVDSLSQ